MAQDFKAALGALYDKFGDKLIEAGVDLFVDKMQGMKTDKAVGGVGEEEQSESSFAEGDGCAASGVTDVTGGIDDQPDDADDSTDYYDAGVFEQKTLEKLKSGSVEIMNSGDVAGAVRDLILMAGEVRKFEEAQITVRTDIAARRDIALANIEVQKEALLTYLNSSFDERKNNFAALFTVVDDALAKDNMQELAMGLEGIIRLAESSPLKDLATIEATATALSDPKHTWDF